MKAFLVLLGLFLAGPFAWARDMVVSVDYVGQAQGGHVQLQMTLDDTVAPARTTLVTTALLGHARIPDLPFENPDGSPLQIDTDYFGKKRDPNHPSPGPIENPGTGTQTFPVW